MTESFQAVESEFADQQRYDESRFPAVWNAARTGASLDAAAEWVRGRASQLLDQATRDGAVLLRDFPASTAEDFDTIINCLGLDNFPYEKSLSNAVRVNRTERVFSANEAPPDVKIFFHHEMAQTPLYPQYIFFFCEVAPDEGGATPLCRSDILYDRLKQQCPDFVRACEDKGLRYSNVMPNENDAASGMGRSWKSTLGVQSRDQAEGRLKELNYDYEWLDDDCLRATTPTLPAVHELPGERKSFFNQLIAAFCGWKDSRNDPSKAICHGDGSSLDAAAVEIAAKLAEDLAYDHAWRVGDVVLLDNTVAMHARRPFRGTRKVLASLAQMHTHAFESARERVG